MSELENEAPVSTAAPAGSWTGRIVWGLLFAGVLATMAWYARATYWQCDDAYISFRYVWHLVHGNGLVFNTVERVEGYTNFLWVLELGAVWKLLGIPPETACDFLSAAFTVGALVCIVLLARRGPWPQWRTFAAFGTLLLLATSRTWAVWTTSGLETRQFTFFVLLGILLTSRGAGRPMRLVAASLSFAAAEYTRPEGPLLWACAGAWLLLEMWMRDRRISLRDALCYGVPFVALVGAHFLWRHAYYGEWFPNTYYAKYVRAWPEAGLRYYAIAAIETGAWLLVPLAVVGALARWVRGDRTHLLPACVCVGHAIYLVRIGGDHFELRPLDFYWPPLALAAVEGMLVAGAPIARILQGRRPGDRLRAQLCVAGLLLGIAAVYGSAVQVAKTHHTERFATRADSHFLFVRLDRESSPWLFALPGMPWLIPIYDGLQDYTLRHGVGTVWREHEVFWRDEMRKWRPYAITRGTDALPLDAVTARGSIGVFGYYLADLELIDQKGLTDRNVARSSSGRPNEERYMAHDRYASPEYLIERGFNMLVEPAQTNRRDALMAAPFALRLTDDVWMPFSSRTPDWVAHAFDDRELWGWMVAREVGCFRAGEDDGWTFEGPAFAAGVRAGMPLTRTIQWFARCDHGAGLDSRDASGGGTGLGTARSPLFRIPPDATLELRLFGVSSGQTGLRVVGGDGEILADLQPKDPAALTEHVDLAPFAGREARVEIYDGSDTGWIGAMGIVLLEPSRLAGPAPR